MTQYPAYTPAASLGKELGIMFAFIVACVVTMGVYSIIWRRIQLRTQEEDLARRKALKGRTAVNGLHYGGLNMSVAAATSGGKRVDEKMVDRDAVLGERVKLPGDGIGRERGTGELL